VTARTRRRDDRPIPAHPYRDTALVFGVMAVVLVVVAVLTGGNLPQSLAAAALFFVLATAWSSWKFRVRIREREVALAAAAAQQGESGSVHGKPPSVVSTQGQDERAP